MLPPIWKNVLSWLLAHCKSIWSVLQLMGMPWDKSLTCLISLFVTWNSWNASVGSENLFGQCLYKQNKYKFMLWVHCAFCRYMWYFIRVKSIKEKDLPEYVKNILNFGKKSKTTLFVLSSSINTVSNTYFSAEKLFSEKSLMDFIYFIHDKLGVTWFQDLVSNHSA